MSETSAWENSQDPRASTSVADWACMAAGILGALTLLAGYDDLPNILIGRSLSWEVEEGRRWACYWTSLVLALMAVWLGRRRKSVTPGSLLRAIGTGTGAIPLGFAAMYLLLGWNSLGREYPRRAHCVNNLKQILLALANYESAHGGFPPAATTDPTGLPLLSWRVAILPFMEQGELYNRFHLDEPWDSEHNRSLLDEMPWTYHCPAQAGWLKGKTLYQAVVGEETVWSRTRGMKLGEITDGTSETISVVESDRPVPWTSPDDVPFVTGDPLTPWEATHAGGANFGFVDGSVRFLKKTIRERTLRALMTRAGHEKLDPDEY